MSATWLFVYVYPCLSVRVSLFPSHPRSFSLTGVGLVEAGLNDQQAARGFEALAHSHAGPTG